MASLRSRLGSLRGVRFLAFAVLLAAAACRVPPSALDVAVGALRAAPEFAGARVGVCVLDLENGQVLAEVDADRGFAPASNLKLVTAAVCLKTLGADYVFQIGRAHV